MIWNEIEECPTIISLKGFNEGQWMGQCEVPEYIKLYEKTTAHITKMVSELEIYPRESHEHWTTLTAAMNSTTV